MICYKFNYINETAVQTIAVPTCSDFYIAIGNGHDSEATITLVNDSTGETVGTASSSSIMPYYGLFRLTTPTEVATKTYTATVSGTIDEQAYSHTIKIKVIANGVSVGMLV